MEQEINIQSIKDEVVNALDAKREWRRDVSGNISKDENEVQKIKLLTFLLSRNILKCTWLNESQEYLYEPINQETNVTESLKEIEQTENLEQSAERLFREDKSLDDEEYEEYFQTILHEVVAELDEEEEYDLPAFPDEYEDVDDWNIRMDVLMQLHNNGFVSMEYCSEHLHFIFRIGERHCELHPEHNGMTKEEIAAEKQADYDILSSEEIN